VTTNGTLERAVVQDVRAPCWSTGFIKLVHKFGAADVVVRGPVHARASLPAALGVALPETGCVKIAQRTYAVRLFTEASFTGEPLKIWVLTGARSIEERSWPTPPAGASAIAMPPS
jgi:hypothetical protein